MGKINYKVLDKILAAFAVLLLSNNAFGQCGNGKGQVYIQVNTKSYANEIYWKIVEKSTNNTVDSTIAGVYTLNNTQYTDTVCLNLNTEYYFQAWDNWGDGWDGGTYALKFGNKTIANNNGASPNNANNGNGTAQKESEETFTLILDTLPDLAILEILSPVINTCQSTQFSISAKVQVKDSALIYKIPLKYKIDNGSWSSPQTFKYSSGLAIDSLVTITLSTTPSITSVGKHRIHLEVDAARDDNQTNDTLSAIFYNDGPKSTFPIAVNFDAATSCGNGSSTCISDGACNLTTDWKNMPGDDLDWSIGSGATNSLGTGPENDHTQGSASGKYLFLESSGCQGGEAYLQLNCAQLNQMSNPYLEFWYHMYGDKMGKLYVEINTSGAWVALDSIVGQQQDSSSASWAFKRINLANYKTTANLRLRGQVGSGFTSDMAIDDITVRDIPQQSIVTRELIMPANNSCGDSSITISVVVSNEGIQPATRFVIWLRDYYGTIVNRLIFYSDTLAFGESDTIHFTGLNTYAGTYNQFRSRIYFSTNYSGPYTDYLLVRRYYKFPTPQTIADTGMCGSGSIQISSTPLSGEEIRWFSDRNGNNLITTGNTLTTGNLTQTTYFYHRTANSTVGCVTDMDSVQVIVNSGISTQLQTVNPNLYRAGANTAVSPDTLIQGDTIYHSIAVPSGKTQAQYGTTWDVQVSRTVSTGTTYMDSTWKASTTHRPTHTFWAQSGTDYKLHTIAYTVRDLITGCDTAITKYIYVIPNPQAVFSADTVCAGSSTSFANNSTITTGGSLTYSWNFGDGNTSTSTSPIHQYAFAGNYSVTLVVTSDLRVVDSLTKTIVVVEIPDADFVANGVCAYDSARFLNRSSVSTGTLTYQWSYGNSQTATTEDVVHFYGSAGQYNVQLIASSGTGCSDTLSRTISVYQVPTAGFSAANVCLADSARFTDTSSLAASYSWNFGGGFTSTTANPVIKYDSNGTYSISQIVNSANGCIDTATAQLQVYEMPSLQVSTSNKCQYDSVVVADNSSNASTYQWIWGDNDTTTTTRGAHKYSSAGSYSIIVNVASVNNCTAADTLAVTVYTVPIARFSATTACETDTTTFANQSSITTGFISSKWFFGTGDSSLQISPKYLYDSADVYRVQLLTTSLNGCVDTAIKMVTVNDNANLDFSISGSCTDETLSITNNTTGSASQVWTFAGTDSTTAFAPTKTYSNAGTYTVWLYAQTSKGCKDSLQKTLQVYQAPNAIFTTNNVCRGDSATMQNFSSNANIVSWNFGDGTSSTSSAPKKLYAQSGQYSIKLTVSNANCVDSTTKSITIYSAPTSNFSAANVCLGDTTHLYDSSFNASGYTWLLGNGLNSTAQSPSLVYASAGNYSVQLITSTPNNCVDTATKTVTVYSLPAAAISAVSTTCTGDTITPTNSTTNANSYQWTFGTNDTLRTQNIGYAFSSNGSYSIVLLATNANGCIDRDTATIDVFATPVANFSTQNVCDRKQSSFTNTTTLAAGTLTYAWNFGDGTGNSTIKNPTYTYASSGVYPVELVATSNRGCQDSITVNDTIYALPNPSFSATNKCENDTTTFTNSSTNATSYVWHFGDGNTSTNTNPKHLYSAAGSYTAKLIATNAEGCVDSTTKTITAYSLPVAGISVSNNCLNDVSTFTNTSTNAARYAWNLGDGTTSTQTNPTHVYATSGVKTVQLIATSSNGCLDTNQASVTIHTLPVASFSANDTCLNDTTYFTNNSQNATSYAWDFDNSASSTTSNPRLKYANAGNYQVELIATSSNGCKDTLVKTVAVFAIPTVSFNQVSSICQNDSLTISNSTTGANSYLWTFGNGDSSTTTSPTLAYNTHGTYTIALRAGNSNGCYVSNSASIVVNPEPQVAYNANGVCYGNTMRFSNQSQIASGTLTYSWFFGDGKGSSAAKNPSYTYADSGFYQVKLIATSNKGCQDSATMVDTVYQLPRPAFSANAKCLNDTTVFVNNTTNSVSQIWHFGDGNTSTNTNPKHLYSAAGTYSVKLIATSKNGCVDSTTKTITVYGLPVAGISVSNNCLNDVSTFTNTSTNAASYAWNLGDGTTSTLANPTHVYATSGAKTVQLIATSSNGCLDTNQATITIYTLPLASFSANDTCLNDTTFFTNSSQNAVSYVWDFDNNSASSKASPAIRYAQPASYSVQLIATSNNGCKDTLVKTVVVHPIPVVGFSMIGSICQNDSFTITNTTTGANSYLWTFGNGDSSRTANPRLAYNKHNTYTVVQNASNQFNCHVIDSSHIVVNAEPVAAFNAANVCKGKAMRFNNNSTVASGHLTYRWNFGDGNSDTANTTLQHTYAQAGIYSSKLVVTSNKGCADSTTQTVTVYTLPVPGFTATTVCKNQKTAFSNTSTNATSYVWHFGDTNSSTNTLPQHVYANHGSYTATLIATNGNGCIDSVSKSITVNSLPIVKFLANNNCAFDTTRFTNNSTNAVSYAWSFGNGATSTAFEPSTVYQVDGTKSIQLIATSNNGCLDTLIKTITIYSLPIARFSFNDTCLNQTTQFVNQSQNATQYQWNFDNNQTSTKASPQLVYTTHGIYNVELIATNQNGCVDTVVNKVRVFNLPIAQMAVNDTCFNAPTRFRNNSTNATNYEWLFDSTQTSTKHSFRYTFGKTGSYLIRLRATNNNGCADTAYKTVKVFKNPTARYNVSDVCFKDTARFTNTSLNTQNVLWSFGNGQNSTSINVDHYYFKPGLYNTRLIAFTAEGCADTATKMLDIKAIPTLSFTVDSTICQFNSLGITNQTKGASGFSWKFGADTVSTDSLPTIIFRKEGKKMVSLMATSSTNCKVADSIEIRVKATPKVVFTTNNVCLGDTTVYTNKSSIDKGQMRYSWNFGDNLGYSTKGSPKYVHGKANTYSTKLVATSLEGCADSASLTNVVYALPKPAFASNTVCFGDSTVITNQTTNAVSFLWKVGNLTSTKTNPSFQLPIAGTHLVELFAFSTNGCRDSIKKTALVNALPTPQFLAQDVCLNNATLFNNQSVGAQTYEWNFGNGNTSTQAQPSITYALANTYSVKLKATTAQGCIDSVSKNVVVNSLPTAQFGANDTCLGQATIFTNNSSNYTQVEWTFGDGSKSKTTSPIYTYALSGNYPVELVATTQFGCSDTARKTVQVFQNPTAQFAVNNVCVHDSARFVNQSNLSVAYLWSLGDGTVSTAKSLNKKYAKSNNYTVQLVVSSANGCTDSVSKPLHIYQKPTAQFTAPNVCLRDSTPFTNTSTGASTFKWQFGNGTTSTKTNPSSYYTNAGTYQVQLVATDTNGCIDMANGQVNVWSVPEAAFYIDGVCIEDSVLFGNNSLSASDITWHFGDGKTSNDYTPKHKYSFADTFKVKLVVENSFGCKDSLTTEHEMGKTPIANFDIGQACEKVGFNFKNKSTTNGETLNYSWDFGDGGSSKKEFPTYAYGHSGTYNVRLVAQHRLGCVDTVTKAMDVRPTPIAQFKTDSIVCADQPIGLFATTLTSNINHQWIIDRDTLTGDTISYVFSEKGDWNITLNAFAEGGCFNQLNRPIRVGELPLARFVANLESCQGEEIDFLDLSTINGREDLKYVWHFGNGDSAFTQDPIYAYNQAGTYKVKQYVSTSSGCVDSVTRELTIHRTPNLNLTIKDRGAYVYFHPGDTQLAKYYWDFGNGNTSRFAKPRNWYNENGTYFVSLRGVTPKGCEASVDTVITLRSTSIEGLSQQLIKAYPNPFSNELQLELSGFENQTFELVIINQQGQVLENHTLTPKAQLERLQISTASWAAGVYQVQLIGNDGKVQVVQLVKG
ncbi:MAG: PKD domain-containing protein [Bacteroidetes bacterium]|nr:PKD domain-containing protein [Bacteroidota bacterium]